MRPHLPLLFLIAFASFHRFATADRQAAQDTEKQPEISLDSDLDDVLGGLVSLLGSTIADKIQEAFFVSNLGVPLAANSAEVQSETQASPDSPDSRPDILQQSFGALLWEEGSETVRSFETVINSTLTLGMLFHKVLESEFSDDVPSNYAPFVPLLKTVTELVATVRDDVRARFPLPATAPGHAERVERVSAVLDHLQQLIVRLARDHKIEKEVIEGHLACVKPFLRDAWVLIGDVAELYPAAIEAVALHVSAVLLPEATFLRSLVILYCFGPYVLGKDAIGGWLFKRVFEAFRV